MTKKYFGTDGIRGPVNSKNINGDMFFKFGLASGTYFKTQKRNKQIAIIAKDTRLSGYTLEPALVSGLERFTKIFLSINLSICFSILSDNFMPSGPNNFKPLSL